MRPLSRASPDRQRPSSTSFGRQDSVSHDVHQSFDARGSIAVPNPAAPERLVESRVATLAQTLQAKRFYITGTVQGVGYRFFVERAAGRLGISGYVKNLPDGRVEVYGMGTGEQLQLLRGELEHGPPGASVDAVREEGAEMLSRYARSFVIEF